jgi:hypothetical protein
MTTSHGEKIEKKGRQNHIKKEKLEKKGGIGVLGGFRFRSRLQLDLKWFALEKERRSASFLNPV